MEVIRYNIGEFRTKGGKFQMAIEVSHILL